MTLRKTTHSIPLVIGITLIATMVIAGGMAIITTKSVFAQGVEKFTATLSGKNEVPAKDTKATGTSEFTLSRDGKTMTYIVNVKDIDKATMPTYIKVKRVRTVLSL